MAYLYSYHILESFASLQYTLHQCLNTNCIKNQNTLGCHLVLECRWPIPRRLKMHFYFSILKKIRWFLPIVFEPSEILVGQLSNRGEDDLDLARCKVDAWRRNHVVRKDFDQIFDRITKYTNTVEEIHKYGFARNLLAIFTQSHMHPCTHAMKRVWDLLFLRLSYESLGTETFKMQWLQNQGILLSSPHTRCHYRTWTNIEFTCMWTWLVLIPHGKPNVNLVCT